VPASNWLTFDALLTERGGLRYTPAGIPAIECSLHHQSVQAEAGGERKVECELFAETGRDARRKRPVLRGIPRPALPDRHHDGAAHNASGLNRTEAN
jgi:primosomal replication protein N